jgi:uncharacterized YigZ family protein
MEAYKTVLSPASAEFVEKRSRFIGTVAPVTDEHQAQDFIAGLKKKYWDATHNVYAYCLRNGQIRRFSDDGEPQGTAGMPVLDVLLKSEVTDVAVVVTRYFGGILLGGGGLVRAYSHSAAVALDAAGIVTMSPVTVCSVKCGYSHYGRVEALLGEYGALVENSAFETDVSVTALIDSVRVEKFAAELCDATAGKASFERFEEKFAILK